MAANARRAWERGSGYRLPALFFASCFVGFALLSMAGLLPVDRFAFVLHPSEQVAGDALDFVALSIAQIEVGLGEDVEMASSSSLRFSRTARAFFLR